MDILSQPKVAFLNSSQGLESSPVTFHFLDTVIPHELLANELYQANLKTIDNFLLCGKECGATLMKMARKLYSMIEKDGQNFKRKALLCITFLLLLSRVQASYLMRKWEECLSQVNLQLPIREMNVYNTGT